MKNQVKIRKMDMSDIHFALKTEMAAFNKTLSEKTIINELLHNDMAHYFVALVDGVRTGYIGVWITEPNAEVLNIVIDGEWRNQGIGKAIMAYVLTYLKARDVEVLTLEVSEHNDNAIAFYKKLGFNEVTRRKKYYPTGEDALLMEMKVKQ